MTGASVRDPDEDRPDDPGPAGPRSAGSPRAGGRLPGRPATDALLAASGRGDLDAFAAFYDLTAPLAVGLAHVLQDDPAPIEHVLEEVYLRLWREAPGYDPAAGPADAVVLRALCTALVGRRPRRAA